MYASNIAACAVSEVVAHPLFVRARSFHLWSCGHLLNGAHEDSALLVQALPKLKRLTRKRYLERHKMCSVSKSFELRKNAM